jgi:hypothetical protein
LIPLTPFIRITVFIILFFVVFIGVAQARSDHPVSLGIVAEGISAFPLQDDIEPGYGGRMRFQVDFNRHFACVVSFGRLKIAEDNGLSPIGYRQTIKTFDTPLSIGMRVKFAPNKVRPFFGIDLTFHFLRNKEWDYRDYLYTYDDDYTGYALEVGAESAISRRWLALGIITMSDIKGHSYLSFGMGMAVYLFR